MMMTLSKMVHDDDDHDHEDEDDDNDDYDDHDNYNDDTDNDLVQGGPPTWIDPKAWSPSPGTL